MDQQCKVCITENCFILCVLQLDRAFEILSFPSLQTSQNECDTISILWEVTKQYCLVYPSSLDTCDSNKVLLARTFVDGTLSPIGALSSRMFAALLHLPD